MATDVQLGFSDLFHLLVRLLSIFRFLWLPGFMLAIALLMIFLAELAPFLDDVRGATVFIPFMLLFSYALSLGIWTLFPFSNLSVFETIILLGFATTTGVIAVFALYSYDGVIDGTAVFASRVFDLVTDTMAILFVWLAILVALFCNARFLEGWNADVVNKVKHSDEIEYIKKELLPHLADDAASVSLSYAREAIRLKKLAFAALNGVGVIVFLAVLAVIFAGALTVSDQRATSAILQAEQAEAHAMRRLQQLLVELADLPNNEILAVDAADNVSSEYEEAIALRDLEMIRQRKEQLPADIQTARSQVELTTKLTNDMRRRVLEQMTDQSAINNTNALIASAVTRFGLIIVLTFFAQALINLYRYSMRLSSFYWSKALLIAITKGDPKAIQELSEVFSPLSVSLGKEPKTPVDEAVKLMNAAKPNS